MHKNHILVLLYHPKSQEGDNGVEEAQIEHDPLEEGETKQE
jgi:hypothetical protein